MAHAIAKEANLAIRTGQRSVASLERQNVIRHRALMPMSRCPRGVGLKRWNGGLATRALRGPRHARMIACPRTSHLRRSGTLFETAKAERYQIVASKIAAVSALVCAEP